MRIIEIADESAIFGGRILADLGYEVIRVEEPDGGRVRGLAPFLADEPHAKRIERSLQHLYHSAGKKSVVIDRSTNDGRQLFERLVSSADALLTTEVFDDASLRASNPGLIHVSVTPFGLDSAWSQRKANDLVAGAAGGLVWTSGSPDDPPNQPGGDQTYKMAGLLSATGILIALAGRERNPPSAHGVHLDISLQESAWMTVMQTSNPAVYWWTKNVPKRPGLTVVHRISDSKFVTTTVQQQNIEPFLDWCVELGIEIPSDRKELLAPFGGARRLVILVREVAMRLTRDEFLNRAWKLDLMALPVLSLPELETTDHYVATKQFVEVAHEPLGELLSFPRSPVDAIGDSRIRRAPLLGEHTDEVIGTLTEPLAPSDPKGRTPRPRALDLANALDGIRVLDFCWMLAGPLGTRILANFGAEVIRVEAGPRAYPDQFPEGNRNPDVGAFHNLVNTQKRSTTIDPRSVEGRELLKKLVSKCDVVTENYRPGALGRMGFSYDVLKSVNPKIVLLHMPGSGGTGPWRDRTSFGNMVSAAGGISSITGFPGRSPRGMGVAYPDFTTPYLMAIVVLEALKRRDQTGDGMELDLSQLGTTVSLIGVEWLQYSSTGTPPPPRANRDPNWCPHGVYPCNGVDEWVAIAAEGDDQWKAICDVMGRSQLVDDPELASHE